VLTVCCQSFNQTIGRMRIDTGPFQRYGIHILEEYQLDWRNWVRQHVKEVALINIRAGKARAIAGHAAKLAATIPRMTTNALTT